MTTLVTPKTYYGVETPVGASSLDRWYMPDGTQLIYWNSTWVEHGNIGEPDFGLLNLGGGTVSGAIGGASGLAELADADFTEVRRDGLDLVDVAQLEQLEKKILARIPATSTSAGSSSFAQNFAITVQSKKMESGETWAPNVPKYGGSVDADQADVTWFSFIQGIYVGESGLTNNFGYPSGWRLIETTLPYTIELACRDLNGYQPALVVAVGIATR